MKFGPWRLKRLATRPATQLLSSPGIVSSVTSGQPRRHVGLELALDRGAGVGGQRREAPGALELARQLGEGDAQRRQVVLLARQRVAEHHARCGRGRAGARASPRRRAPSACRRPPTSARRPSPRPRAGGSGASRRAGSSPSRAPSRRSSSTCCSGARGIGVVVERGIPALRVDVGDRVVAAADVAPERVGVAGVGEDGADADDGDGGVGGGGHGSARLSVVGHGRLRA